MKTAKKILPLFAAPGLTLVIISVVFYQYRLFPFGNKTAAWCDMYQQVIPLLMELKDIVDGNASMFLNLQNAGGMNFWGVFLFFLSSPLTILALLVPKADLYLFVNVLVILKMLLCAATASFFFRKTFSGLSLMQNTALALMYAFCGYSMFYYQNHVWLDIMYLFPLLLLSLRALEKNGKVLPYILVLSGMIVVHFYLSYMVLLFIILVFGIFTVFSAEQEKRRKTILLLGVSTGISALLTGIVWLPAFLQYLASARTGSLIESLWNGKLFTDIHTTVALILCTGAVFACLPMIPQIRGESRNKSGLITLFVLLLIPVFIEPINKMWHTGSYQAFPLRYSYMTIFIGLTLLAMVLNYQNQFSSTQPSRLSGVFLGTLAPAGAFLVACLFVKNKYEALTVYTRTLWGNETSFLLFFSFAIIMMIAYVLLMVLYRYHYLGRIAFSLLLCATVTVEAGFYISVYFGSAAATTGGYRAVVDMANRIPDQSLYRVKSDRKYFDANLIGGLGYGSLSHYTSLTSKDFHQSMKKLGYSSYWMEVNSNGGTALTDAILANRYRLALSQELETNVDPVYDNTIYTIYQNPIAAGFGIVANGSDLLKAQMLAETGTRFMVQEQVFQALFSMNEPLMTEYQPDTWSNVKETAAEGRYIYSFYHSDFPGSMTYHISVKGRQTLYFDCFDTISNDLEELINKSFDVYVNGRLLSEQYPSQNENGLLELGTFFNEDVTVELLLLKPVDARSIGVAGMNLDLLEQALSDAGQADLRQHNNALKGSVYAAHEGQYLFVPVAADSSECKAVVNGMRVQAIQVFDGFLAIPLQRGENRLSLSFLPSGFMTGLLFSIFGMLFMPLFLLLLKRGGYQYMKWLERPASVVFLLLFSGVLLAIYFLPVFIYLLQ